MLSFLDVTAQDLFSSVPFGCYNDVDEKGNITWVAMWGYIKKIQGHKWLLSVQAYIKNANRCALRFQI